MSDRWGFCTPPPRMTREVTTATGAVVVIHVCVHSPTKMQRHRISVLLVLFVSEREGSHLFCGLASQPNFVFLSTRPSCEMHRCFFHVVLVMDMKYFPRGRRARWQLHASSPQGYEIPTYFFFNAFKRGTQDANTTEDNFSCNRPTRNPCCHAAVQYTIKDGAHCNWFSFDCRYTPKFPHNGV